MKTTLLRSLLLSSTLLLSLPAQVRVDLAGFQSLADGTERKPVWWKDGIPQVLRVPEGPEMGYPVAISTNGRQVFITGTIGEPLGIARRPVLWIDGEFQELPTLPGHQYGNTIPSSVVQREEYLIIGGTASSASVAVPVYWSINTNVVDSKPQMNILPFPTTYGGSVRSVIQGPDAIYFAGFVFNTARVARPCVWRVTSNPESVEPMYLESDPSTATLALSVFVTPTGDVHAAGIHQAGRVHTPLYWLNGKRTALLPVGGGATGNASGVTVTESGDVIVSGYVDAGGNTPKPATWVNGRLNLLPTGDKTPYGMTHGLASAFGMVVVAGSEYEFNDDRDGKAVPAIYAGTTRFAVEAPAGADIAQPDAGIALLDGGSSKPKALQRRR